jgi:hypothetical protein
MRGYGSKLKEGEKEAKWLFLPGFLKWKPEVSQSSLTSTTRAAWYIPNNQRCRPNILSLALCIPLLIFLGPVYDCV